jgi:hypothetical protein
MPRTPKPLPTWEIYIARAKAVHLGTVEAADADAAIEAAAKEFKADPKRLYCCAARLSMCRMLRSVNSFVSGTESASATGATRSAAPDGRDDNAPAPTFPWRSI